MAGQFDSKLQFLFDQREKGDVVGEERGGGADFDVTANEGENGVGVYFGQLPAPGLDGFANGIRETGGGTFTFVPKP